MIPLGSLLGAPLRMHFAFPVLLAAGLVVGSLSFVLSRALFKALPGAGECRVRF